MRQADPQRPDVRLVVSSRPRANAPVDATPWPDVADPSAAELCARISEVPSAWGWTLSGGEPTTRADLPALIRQLADAGANNIGLVTDGFALTSGVAAASLRQAGLERVRIRLHSGRQDANDWLAGSDGAAKRVRRAVSACAAAGLVVEIETALTRSTTAHLVETVELVAALGAQVIHLRRSVLAPGPHRNAAVAVSPRFEILRPHLEDAVRTGVRRGLVVRTWNLPRCAAPATDPARATRDCERWLWPRDPAWDAVGQAVEPRAVQGCPDCSCEGAPADYVALFGRSEFTPRPGPRVYAPEVDADGLIRLHLGPDEPTRTARMKIVAAIQSRPKVLELVGWASHPKMAELLTELRLLEPQVVLVGAVDRLASLSDRALAKIAEQAAIDAALYALNADSHDRVTGRVGSFDATLALLHRLRATGLSPAVHGAVDQPPTSDADRAAWAAITSSSPPQYRSPSGEPHSVKNLR